MLYGSIFAFFIPCIVIVTTYGCEAFCRWLRFEYGLDHSYIFHALHMRMRAVRLQEMSAGKFIGFSMDMNNTAQTAIAGKLFSQVSRG